MERPFVYVNMAMTADGKITSAAREYPRFTSSYDRRSMDRLRAEADAVLVGAGTVRADDPPLAVRDPEMREHRRTLGKPDGLVHVIVSASLGLDPTSHVFEHARSCIVATVDDAPAEAARALGARAEIWRLGHGAVDLAELLRRLKQRGVERLLCEGGGELNWALVSAGFVDELYLTLAPVLLGGRDAPTPVEGQGLTMAEQRRLRLVELHREGDELYCRYAVER